MPSPARVQRCRVLPHPMANVRDDHYPSSEGSVDLKEERLRPS